MRELFKVLFNVEPITWGMSDRERRRIIREEIKKQVANFSEDFVEGILESCGDIAIELDCYLTNPAIKDIDNLAKIPMDSVLFSANNERGYKTWEANVTSLIIRKIRHERNMLGIAIYGSP